MLFGLVSMVAVFSKKKGLFEREFCSGTYGIGAWALSFMAVEIPREIVHSAVYSAVVLGLTTLDGTFFEIWFTVFLSTLSGGSFGIFFGAISSNPTEASLTIPGIERRVYFFEENNLCADMKCHDLTTF